MIGGQESTEVTAGIWGFIVLFGLGLACWFLFRSMNAQLRRVRFREREEENQTPPDADDDPIGSSRH